MRCMRTWRRFRNGAISVFVLSLVLTSNLQSSPHIRFNIVLKSYFSVLIHWWLRAQDVYKTAHQRQCNVMTLHRRWRDVVSTLRSRLVRAYVHMNRCQTTGEVCRLKFLNWSPCSPSSPSIDGSQRGISVADLYLLYSLHEIPSNDIVLVSLDSEVFHQWWYHFFYISLERIWFCRNYIQTIHRIKKLNNSAHWPLKAWFLVSLDKKIQCPTMYILSY